MKLQLSSGAGRQARRSVLRPFFRLLAAPCRVTKTAVMATIMHAINALKGTLPTLRTCATAFCSEKAAWGVVVGFVLGFYGFSPETL